ncbi:MAG: phage baseplate protein [Pyrinomonadaceae bacterium]|nr:phage baseplate protein [Pyrinomonadaceae bacterium]
MRALSTPELLEAWERGLNRSSLERALLLLSAATGVSLAHLSRLSIGERDARLLKLRETAFGSELSVLAECPACHERLEMTFNVADLCVGQKRAEPSSSSQEIAFHNDAPPQTFSLAVEAYEISFRLPDSRDLLALARHADADAARRVLLSRCILKATFDGADVSFDQLPAGVLTAIEERIAEIDPQADVRLALSCTQCTQPWEEIFDINSFFWTEINAWAKRILREVHTLARAYGWRERDILEMSAWRREFYLNMVAG